VVWRLRGSSRLADTATLSTSSEKWGVLPLPDRRGGNGVEWVDDISGYGWVAHSLPAYVRASRPPIGRTRPVASVWN
jgi:hypothetical protein